MWLACSKTVSKLPRWATAPPVSSCWTRRPSTPKSGGQVGDRGVIRSRDGGVRFEVDDTTRGGDQHLHYGRLVAGTLRSGDPVVAAIDGERRGETVLNHSATHLLHAALREVLGNHVEQRGSLVAPDRLRFDFSHPKPVTASELQRIETLVNDRVRDNTADSRSR